MSIKIGITGGIGSGKSTVCTIFELLEIPVFYSDIKAKKMMYKNVNIKLAIKKCLGNDAYHSNGRPNRKFIAKQIFSDKKTLKKINNIVHPAVRQSYVDWSDNQNSKYTLNEAALLIESDTYKSLDKIIVISAPEKLRISRIIKRDNITIKQAKARIDNQLEEKKMIDLADYVIINNGEDSIIRQVLHVHNSILEYIDI